MFGVVRAASTYEPSFYAVICILCLCTTFLTIHYAFLKSISQLCEDSTANFVSVKDKLSRTTKLRTEWDRLRIHTIGVRRLFVFRQNETFPYFDVIGNPVSTTSIMRVSTTRYHNFSVSKRYRCHLSIESLGLTILVLAIVIETLIWLRCKLLLNILIINSKCNFSLFSSSLYLYGHLATYLCYIKENVLFQMPCIFNVSIPVSILLGFESRKYRSHDTAPPMKILILRVSLIVVTKVSVS